MKKIKVAIAGLGNIAHAYEDNPNVLKRIRIPTHYAAIRRDKRFALVAACDPLRSPRDRFFKKTNGRVRIYSSVQQMLKAEALDLLVIATPTDTHFRLCIDAMRLGVRAIFCEKPIAYSSKQARTLLHTAKNNNVLFGVNYFRSYDSHYVQLASAIRRRIWGRPILVNVKYSGGIYNTATHCIQLLTKIFGHGSSVRAFGEEADTHEQDPTLSFIVCHSTFNAIYEGLRTTAYRIIEIDMLFEKGRLLLHGDSLSEYRVGTDHGFSFLRAVTYPRIKIDIGNSMRDVYDNLYDYLRNGKPLLCQNEDALHAVTVAERSVQSLTIGHEMKL